MSAAVSIVRADGEGERLRFMGGGVLTMKATAEETGGAFLLFEDLMTQGKTTPLHTHANEDETLYVLDGELLVHIDGVDHAVGPRGVAVAPRGVPHAFLVTSDDGARAHAADARAAPRTSTAARASRPQPTPTAAARSTSTACGHRPSAPAGCRSSGRRRSRAAESRSAGEDLADGQREAGQQRRGQLVLRGQLEADVEVRRLREPSDGTRARRPPPCRRATARRRRGARSWSSSLRCRSATSLASGSRPPHPASGRAAGRRGGGARPWRYQTMSGPYTLRSSSWTSIGGAARPRLTALCVQTSSADAMTPCARPWLQVGSFMTSSPSMSCQRLPFGSSPIARNSPAVIRAVAVMASIVRPPSIAVHACYRRRPAKFAPSR